MSDLQPKGAILRFNGEERKLIWDYGAIEKVQEKYGGHPFTAIRQMFWEDEINGERHTFYQAAPVLDLVSILLETEVDREKYFEGKSTLKRYTRAELGMLINRINANDVVTAIVESWNNSVILDEDDEDDEEDSKNLESEQH